MDLSTRQGRREQGQRIQRAVERAGLSIEELAGRIGCSRALIYQYVSGTTLAQPDRLQQIAMICSVPLSYFYGDTADVESPVGARTGRGSGRPDSPAARLPAPQEMTARLTDSLHALQELAEAQASPPDYRALASTCERILSLAVQVGDRAAQTRAQHRLGSALLAIADYPRAVESLNRAVALADEAGDFESEILARQSLGKALSAMGRVQEAREQFQQVAEGPVPRDRWRGTLSLGVMHTLRGEYQEAMQRFDEAAALLEEGEATGLLKPDEVAAGLLYVNASRTSIYMDGGDFRGARPLAERCASEAESLGIAEQHLEARFDLAWCDFCIGQWTHAYRGLSTIVPLARFVGDQGRETMARAWLGIFLAAAGDHDSAIAQGKDALATALSRGDRRSELYAQLALADAYTGVSGRDGEARYHANQALAVATAQRLDRAEIECRLRYARLSAEAGELPDLKEAATRALTLSLRLGARHLESLARCCLAEALLREHNSQTGEKSAARGAAGRKAAAPLDLARQEAAAALAIAEELEFVEGRWRAHEMQARLTFMEGPNGLAAAESHLRASVAILETLRAALIEAGIPDALLENEDCVRVYSQLAQLLRQQGRDEEAESFLDQTGWPPLVARLATDAGVAVVQS